MRFCYMHQTLLIWICLSYDGSVVFAFLKHISYYGGPHAKQRPLCSVNRDEENTIQPPLTPGSFNPFEYNAKLGLSMSPPAVYAKAIGDDPRRSNTISLRRTQMQALTDAMLNADPFNKEQLISILQENKQFLLEPLEDEYAVQETDSIYRLCTNRSGRYRTYAESMESRLHAVRDPSARLVLSTMKEYVLQFESSQLS